MKSFTFFEEPDPNIPIHNKIVTYCSYHLFIDEEKNIQINISTDTNFPCSHAHIANQNLINETMTLDKFFQLKQSKKYQHLLKAKKELSKFLTETILAYEV